MKIRPAEPRDADAVLALMEGLTRPAVADDPEPQREVFLAHLDHQDALVFEPYGFEHYARAYALEL